MFNFHLKRELNDVSREPAYMLNKYQSVKSFRGMKVHSSQYCSTKCKIKQFSNEIFHVKFDLQYFVTESSDERNFDIESLQYL